MKSHRYDPEIRFYMFLNFIVCTTRYINAKLSEKLCTVAIRNPI